VPRQDPSEDRPVICPGPPAPCPAEARAEANRAILLDPTAFPGTADEVPDEEVIFCTRSVLCHYEPAAAGLEAGWRSAARPISAGLAGSSGVAFPPKEGRR
jgi:hypothetical protein